MDAVSLEARARIEQSDHPEASGSMKQTWPLTSSAPGKSMNKKFLAHGHLYSSTVFVCSVALGADLNLNLDRSVLCHVHTYRGAKQARTVYRNVK